MISEETVSERIFSIFSVRKRTIGPMRGLSGELDLGV